MNKNLCWKIWTKKTVLQSRVAERIILKSILEKVCDCMDWIQLTEGVFQGRAYVSITDPKTVELKLVITTFVKDYL